MSALWLHIAAIATALFAWWAGTGLVLLVERRLGLHGGPPWGSLLTIAAGLAGVYLTRDASGPGGQTIGFLSALGIWGTLELAFLSGAIAGPNKAACKPDLALMPRLLAAARVIYHHELALLLSLLAITFITYDHVNSVAFFSFFVLLLMRLSTKINLFFGVRVFSFQMLPKRAAFIGSYFRIGRNTPLMALSVSICILAVIGAGMIAFGDRANLSAETPSAFGATLVWTLCVLGLVEHLFLAFPWSESRLWRWALTEPAPARRR